MRLTAAGEKLAGLVLRRHRLVELFLVQVMGMSWADVHDDAEQLEHVVSERLIDRIDEMLGRPTHDPHGDPIPSQDGAITTRHLDSLLTCPLGTPLKVTRITDQDPAFLRFIESNGLKPGEPVAGRIARRRGRRGGAAAEGPSDHDRRARRVETACRSRPRLSYCAPSSISYRTHLNFDYSNILRLGVATACSLLAAGIRVDAQSPAAADSSRKWEITDNSFLVEEAFNQEAGVVQNIFTWTRGQQRRLGRQFHAGVAGARHERTSCPTRFWLPAPATQPASATCC